MYIKYNAKIYDLIYSNLKEKYVITTYCEEKVDETFYKMWDYYAKDYVEIDPNIQDIYDVDFYVTYTDDSETLKHGEPVTRWNINKMGMLYRKPDMEKGEVGLHLPHDSWSDDWIQDDKYSCSKIVDLYDCSDYTVVYTYSVKDGKKLDEPLVEEVVMTAEDFLQERLKYRLTKI